MSWTPERITELKKLWPDHSASQIADILGDTSRNAVIGKANRLGLSSPNDKKIKKNKVAGTKSIRGIRRNNRTRNLMPRFSGNAALKIDIDDEYIPVHDDVVVPISMKLKLEELNHTTCKWPTGDPSQLDTLTFCGHKPMDEKPYCEYHCNRAYLNSQNRQR